MDGTELNTNPAEQTTTPIVTPSLEPFKTFATQADYDRDVQSKIKANEENARKKAEKELEQKSLTEAQKFQALADEIKAERELVKKERAEVAAKAAMTKLGIEESQYADMLDNIVSSDIEETKARAEKLGNQILTIANGIAAKKIQEQMKSTPIPQGTPNNEGTSLTDEQKLSVLLEKVRKTPNDKRLMQEYFAAKERIISGN